MKFMPEAIARKVASQQLLAAEHSPRILFVGGIIGMVGSTVLACRATLKMEEVLNQIENDKRAAHGVKDLVDRGEIKNKDTTYSDAELRKDLTIITVRGAGNIAKLYGPSILLGAASIFALTKSHNILTERNLALTAAYAAVDTAFTRYRERVVDRFGEETDRELRYETESVDVIDENGKITSEQRVTDAPGSIYSRFYDEHSSRNWSPDPDINMLFLRNVQNYMNDKLKIRGHVFLNEVYSELGLSHTRPGAVVGWRWAKNSGDDIIDFGIWEGAYGPAKDFFNGREGAILLDFNVDGVIYDKIDESY